jgi:hypothetical protein
MELPEDIQMLIWRVYFNEHVLKLFRHKDWWFHTVECRVRKGRFHDMVSYLDAELVV